MNNNIDLSDENILLNQKMAFDNYKTKYLINKL